MAIIDYMKAFQKNKVKGRELDWWQDKPGQVRGLHLDLSPFRQKKMG